MQPSGKATSSLVTRPWQHVLLLLLTGAVVLGGDAASPNDPPADKFYRIVDGKVDARTYNGFRRYHAGCNHCHGPDGTGSTFGPALVTKLSDVETFRTIVLHG